MRMLVGLLRFLSLRERKSSMKLRFCRHALERLRERFPSSWEQRELFRWIERRLAAEIVRSSQRLELKGWIWHREVTVVLSGDPVPTVITVI
jgi:hypothetical protein